MLFISVGGSWYYWIQNQDQPIAEIKTAPVRRGNLVKSLTLSGQMEQSNIISVFTKASGVVGQVYVTDGQQVAAGQKLAEIVLDPEGKTSQAQAWAQYLSAKNSVASSQNQLNTLESKMWAANDNFIHNAVDLDKAETSSEYIQTNREWLAAENDYLNQKNVVAQAQASQSQAWNNYQLYQSTIVAPVDGVIVGLNLAEGLTISYTEGSSGGSASQTVARIQTVGTPVASFSVTEVDINLIEADSPVIVSLDSLEEGKFTGKVVAIDRVGSVTNGVTQYQILVSLDEANDQLLPNMAATAELILDQKSDVLIIPSGTVIDGRDGKKIVRVVKDGKPQPMEVEVGLENDTEIEIISGLNEGDQVVLDNQTATTFTTNQSGFGMGLGVGGGMSRPPGM